MLENHDRKKGWLRVALNALVYAAVTAVALAYMSRRSSIAEPS